ncbi:pentatricopeptide repeat-containing protein At3g57430, chloroplastic [Selaginella moellendorffii]|uniref:pentatricopeptide repeat-containing protein At3g57430, chloroplastic n=1 Tax=Selaginella moellendorffii TaxID=88036 RepID=UPI000D1CDC30|nr:pentatricopeptide repeat-containing protein At3g57430, chloroplastic [Selaginella moellendorffii]|eukprot:XP_024518174.1 pentatricopeptide repeat-containing protein At3g57430, chloroplastic [Selaginella moellendorffii]
MASAGAPATRGLSLTVARDSTLAFRVFQEMQQDGTRPDAFTFVGILDACTDLEHGRKVHSQATADGFTTDVGVGNALLSMYGRCSSVSEAREVFDGILLKNSVSWAAMLTSYTQLGHAREAMELSRLMSMEGFRPNRASLLGLLAACATLEDLEQGRKFHATFLASGFMMDVFVETTLVNMYGKCGSLAEARGVLEGMEVKSVVSWNAMITAYAQHRHGREALELLKKMDLEGIPPSKVTFVSILDACASSGDLTRGRSAHSRAIATGFGGDVNVNNTLVSMYGKCASLDEARKVFDEMPSRDLVSWNALAVEYSQHGCGKEALKLLWKMDLEGLKPDKISYTALLNACVYTGEESAKAMHRRVLASGFQLDGNIVANFLINLYAKCGSLENSKCVFDGLKKKDVVSWNAMLTAYIQLDSPKEALKLFQAMDMEGTKPDQVSYVLALDACAGAVAPTQGKLFHSRVASQGLDSDDTVRNAIVNMYAECGNLDAANREFERIKRRDVVSWTVMVAANAQHGNPRDSLKLFWKMQQDGTKADDVSFLCAILSCSHSGLVKDAMACFSSMVEDHGIQPLAEHFGCVVDALAKVGRLGEAEEFSLAMDAVSWRAFLSACRVHGDAKRGVKAASLIDASDPNSYVLLSNLLTSQSTLEPFQESLG